LFRRAGTFPRRLFATTSATLCEIALCLAFCSLRAAFWRRQLYSGPPRLGQTNGDRLLWRAGAVFAFPNVFHFFAHKLARLGGRRLAFALIFARAFNRFFFWHNKMISPLTTRLDVKESGESYLPPLVGSKEPVLSSALLTAALLAAALLTTTLLTATLFFTLAPLTFALLFLSILLLSSALLSGGRGFARFIWILLCVHDAFL
jgi:hypothetical protein